MQTLIVFGFIFGLISWSIAIRVPKSICVANMSALQASEAYLGAAENGARHHPVPALMEIEFLLDMSIGFLRGDTDSRGWAYSSLRWRQQSLRRWLEARFVQGDIWRGID
ncbi:MAG: hypothetical protein Q7S01_03850 [bacterium]|nr:hypothetical protein [bacterium]